MIRNTLLLGLAALGLASTSFAQREIDPARRAARLERPEAAGAIQDATQVTEEEKARLRAHAERKRAEQGAERTRGTRPERDKACQAGEGCKQRQRGQRARFRRGQEARPTERGPRAEERTRGDRGRTAERARRGERDPRAEAIERNLRQRRVEGDPRGDRVPARSERLQRELSMRTLARPRPLAQQRGARAAAQSGTCECEVGSIAPRLQRARAAQRPAPPQTERVPQ